MKKKGKWLVLTKQGGEKFYLRNKNQVSKPVLYCIGPESWSLQLLKDSHKHWICSHIFAVALEGSNVFQLAQYIEHGGGRSDIQVYQKPHHAFFDVYCSYFSDGFAALSWKETLLLSFSAWCLFPWWYEQLI